VAGVVSPGVGAPPEHATVIASVARSEKKVIRFVMSGSIFGAKVLIFACKHGKKQSFLKIYHLSFIIYHFFSYLCRQIFYITI
jgi:hypothetical protein